MSEANIDFEVRFSNQKITDRLHQFLLNYGTEPEAKKQAEQHLSALNLNSKSLFDSMGADSEISDVSLSGDGTLRFHIFGGVHGGSDFSYKLQSLIIRKKPEYLYSVLYNDQVNEYQFQVYEDGKLKTFGTGNTDEVDEALYDAFKDESPMAVFQSFYKDSRLEMQETDPLEDERSRKILDILSDNGKYRDTMIGHVINGSYYWLVLLLSAWLVFGYFWTGLIVGGVVGVFYTLRNTLYLMNARRVYDDSRNEIVGELSNLGLSDDAAKKMAALFETAIKSASK